MPWFDSAPVTKLKHDDARTLRFLELLAALWESHAGPALREADRPLAVPQATMARATADAYARRDYASADQSFLDLANLVARHPSATRLINLQKDCWKISKDPAGADAALERLRTAQEEDRQRFGERNP